MVCLLGGLCALLVFGVIAGLTRVNYFAKIKGKSHIAKTVPEPTPDAVATSAAIRVDSFLVDVPSLWRQEPVPDPCPGGNPLPILVLPHYIPLHARIQRTLATWKACAADPSIRRVVVVSPDHRHRLAGGVATFSGSGYLTPLGEIAVDPDTRSQLAANGVRLDEALFREEHGVGVFPAFIKQAFPEATLVPIVISARATQAEVLALGEVLRPVLDDGSTLVVISADFSHYLSHSEADRRDRELATALERRDAAFIWATRDAHTDFGRGLWLGMRLAGSASFRRLGWVNSAEIGGPASYTTSFWFGWWEH